MDTSKAAATSKPRTVKPATEAPKAAPKAAIKPVVLTEAFESETQAMVKFSRMAGDRNITHYVMKDEWIALGSPSAITVTISASE